jgi:hypothetical protein
MIPFLIDKQDTVEVVRDQIGAILATEAESQKQLAETSGEDSAQWTFRTYIERSNPWAEFLDATEPQPPLINVTLESCDYQMNRATIVGEFIGTEALFNIDCYGHGMGSDDPAEPGHTAGDKMGCLEAVRAARFVRNVLMSAEYIYLGLRGTDKEKWVHQRWIDTMTIFQPSLEGRELQQVVAARIALRVQFNEFAPQHAGMPLESVRATVKRRSTGEVYFVGEYE